MPTKKFLPSFCHFKNKNCNPYFIVIMITVLIMIGIFWVINFKTRNYFGIFYTQNVYLRLSMYDCSNFVHLRLSFKQFKLIGRITISELKWQESKVGYGGKVWFTRVSNTIQIEDRIYRQLWFTAGCLR
jgi:hypothetical protein